MAKTTEHKSLTISPSKTLLNKDYIAHTKLTEKLHFVIYIEQLTNLLLER